MPAPKNKLALEIDGRENKTSIIQRFVTEQPAQTNNNIPEEKSEASPQFYLKNALEESVLEEVSATLKHMRDVCKCEKCFYDICALVLNAIPPQYATTEQGELLEKANILLNIQTLNVLSNEIFKAIETVKQNPRHI